MKKIKLNKLNDAQICLYTSKNREATIADCEKLYNDLREFGVSLYHQVNYDLGYRVRVFRYNGYVYITYALKYVDSKAERVAIQEYELSNEDDAKKIARFFVRNHNNLLNMGREAIIDADTRDETRELN